MNKYDILVTEQYTGVYEVEGVNYYDAKSRLEGKIDSGKIILDNTDTYIRNYKNNNSRLLDERVNMLIYYNPKINKLSISHNNHSKDYTCYDVKDFINNLTEYCNTYLEDNEITSDLISNEMIALRASHRFYPVEISEIAFFDNLIKTSDKVQFNGKKLSVYCAKNYQGEIDIDEYMGNSYGYLVGDYILEDEDKEVSIE